MSFLIRDEAKVEVHCSQEPGALRTYVLSLVHGVCVKTSFCLSRHFRVVWPFLQSAKNPGGGSKDTKRKTSLARWQIFFSQLNDSCLQKLEGQMSTHDDRLYANNQPRNPTSYLIVTHMWRRGCLLIID
jgi:hypothetical protein